MRKAIIEGPKMRTKSPDKAQIIPKIKPFEAIKIKIRFDERAGLFWHKNKDEISSVLKIVGFIGSFFNPAFRIASVAGNQINKGGNTMKSFSLKFGKDIAYAGAAICLGVLVLIAFGIVGADVGAVIMSLVGFPAGAAGLRAYINSKGIKTYLVAGSSVILGALLAFNVITVEVFWTIFGVILSATGITLTQATTKV